jgi:hypothetical protein
MVPVCCDGLVVSRVCAILRATVGVWFWQFWQWRNGFLEPLPRVHPFRWLVVVSLGDGVSTGAAVSGGSS